MNNLFFDNYIAVIIVWNSIYFLLIIIYNSSYFSVWTYQVVSENFFTDKSIRNAFSDDIKWIHIIKYET